MKRRIFRENAEPTPGLDMGALAPMVDMMTMILVLLLRSYATDPAPMPPEGRLELAPTLSEDPRRPAVEILISDEAVYINGHRLLAVAYMPEGQVVRELYDPLLAMREKGRLEIHAHRQTPWSVLGPIMNTARAAGFEQIALVGLAGAEIR